MAAVADLFSAFHGRYDFIFDWTILNYQSQHDRNSSRKIADQEK